MPQIFPQLPEISVAAAGNTPEEKIDSIVRQINEQNRIISNSFANFKNESWMQMHPQWTDSWTTNSSWTDIEGSLGSINFDDWEYHTWYFEMVAKTDAGTGHYRLFDTTDNAPVAGSEITTTSTTPTRIRSEAIDKPDGTHTFKIQHYIEGGDGSTQYVNSMMSRMVLRIESNNAG